MQNYTTYKRPTPFSLNNHRTA